jgi:hypothetical protein
MTLKEAKNLKHGDTLLHRINKNHDGSPQQWRVSGKVKLWKRDPSRIRVPVKYGLYRNDYVTENDLHLVDLEYKAYHRAKPIKEDEDDGVSGQDRKGYTDDQDRDNYYID